MTPAMALARSSVSLASSTLLAIVVSTTATGCVSQIIYDREVASAAKAQADADAKAQADAAQIQALGQQLAAAEATTQDRDTKLSELSTTSHNLQAQLDEATAINQQLRGELERLGKNVDQILKEKGVLAQSLTDLKGRLDDLRKAQAAADARAKLFQDFVKKFKSMVDAGELKIVTRRGRLVLQLPNDVLFDSGAAEVKPQGKVAIAQIAKALASLGDRQFQVDGNTDNVPMNGGRNATNWELSTSRALSVLKLLIADGVPPKGLSAAGYGEFDPIAPNDTADGRAKNRRIEITLQPNIDELVGAPALAGADGK